MREIFSLENRYRCMALVEAALALAEAELGLIPSWAAREIAEFAVSEKIDPSAVASREREVGHETMALVLTIADSVREAGGYVHYGATSSDILDTATALQVKEASSIILSKMARLIEIMIERGEETLEITALGRTHGMAALPIPFGFKFAVWVDVMLRNALRFSAAARRACRGKMSGAVGTMAAFSGLGRELQDRVMEMLGLEPAPISTQVVPRDSLAELILTIALISSTLDMTANEVRNLQRTEIGEVREPFRTSRQVGSSTMPHKRNPIMSEKVCGLARIMRSLALAALENVVLEHERDLTNSSVERIMVPEAFLLLDEQLSTMIKVMEGLEIDEKAIKRNLNRAGGFIMAERVMIELARSIGRQRAHEILRRLSMKAYEEERDLAEVLAEEDVISSTLGADLKELLDPNSYLGEGREIASSVFSRARAILPLLRKVSSRLAEPPRLGRG